MLVWRLGQASLAGFLGHGLTIRDDRIRHNEVALSILFPQVLQADLDVELTAACNDVLTAFLCGADNKRIGLGELLQTFDEPWEILTILWLHSNLHDRRHTIFHWDNVVSVLDVCDGTSLQNVLINAYQGDSVA